MSNTESPAAVRPGTFIPAFNPMTLIVIGIAAALLFGGAPAGLAASTYTLTNTASPNWSVASNWTGGTGAYPGQSPGDTAIVNLCCGFTLTVDIAVPNTVILQNTSTFNSISIPAASRLTLDPSSTLSSSNTVSVDGGVLEVAAGGPFSPPGNVTLNSGQLTLTGGYSTSNGSIFAFHGGTIAGPGTLTITNTSNFDGSTGNMTLTGSAIVQVLGSGIVRYWSTLSGGGLSINSGSHVQTSGEFNFSSTSPAIGTDNLGGAAIDVLSGGFLRSSSGLIQPPVNNAGTVTTSGPVTLAGGGTHNGIFDAPNSTNLIRFSGNHKFNSGTTFNNAIATPAYSFIGATSTFDIASNVTIPNFGWSGGTIGTSGTGILTVRGTCQFDASAAPLTLNSTLAVGVPPTSSSVSYVPGSPGLTINGQLAIANVVPNTSSLSLPGTSSIGGTGSIAIGTQGTLNTTGNVSVAPALNINGSGGAVSIASPGMLTLSGGGSVISTGSLAFPGATLKLTAGTFTAADTAPLSGSGGTLNVAGATLSFTAATSPLLPALQVDSGQVRLLTASENLSLPQLVWNGGSFIAAAGVAGAGVTVAGNTTMPAPVGVVTIDNITFANNGNFAFSNPTFGMRLQNAAVYQNNNIFDSTAGGTIASDLTSVFQNGVSGPGVVRMSGGTTTQFVPQFQQTFSGSTVSSQSSPTGSIAFSGGGLMSAGTTMSTSSAANSINFNGTLPFALQGGTLSGPGPFLVSAGGLVNITGPVSLNAPLQNSGTIVDTSPATVLVGALSIVNQASGVFDIQTDAALTGISCAFSNLGILKKTAGSGVMSFGPAVSNSGSVLAQIGTIGFSGNLLQNSPGITTLGPGSISVGGGSGNVTLNGGKLTGSGNVTGTMIVNAGAVIAPGSATSTGAISVSGNYTQAPAGTLAIKLAGNLSGQYDTVAVGGTASLNGLLNVSILGAWSPLNGDAYTFMTFASNGGTAFATPTFPSSSFGLKYLPAPAAATSAVLMVASTDLTVTQSAPASVPRGQNAVITLTVTNNGPSPASGVTLVDTFSGPASFVSATTTVGSCSGTGPVTCGIGNLAPAGTATVTITLGTTTAGTILNSASVSGNEFDAATANNATSPASIAISPVSDLSLTLTGPATSPGTATYTVTVANAGPDASSTAWSLSLSLTGGTITGTTGGVTCTPPAGTAMTCTGPALAAPGGSAALTVNTSASSSTMVLTGTLTYAGDPVTSNNGPVSVTTTLAGSTDLAITQTAPASVAHGSNATIVLTVINNGPGTAIGVVVNDTFTTGTLVSVTPSVGSCSGTGPISCSLGSLASSATATITIVLAPPLDVPEVNSATVSSAGTDTNPANNSSSATITVIASSDLSLTTPAPTHPVLGGSSLTQSFILKNNGPDPSGAYQMSFTVVGATIVSMGSCCESCTLTKTTASCAGGGLLAGASTPLLFNLLVGNDPAMTISGSVTCSGDATISNNTASASFTVTPTTADISAVKSGPQSAQLGQDVKYTIVVANHGPTTATGVALFDPLPAGLTLKPGSITGAQCADFPCELGTIDIGASVTVTATYTVNPGAPSRIQNSVAVFTLSQDPDASNNGSSAFTTVIGCGVKPPTLISPAAGMTVSSPVTFTWSAVTGASQYEVFLSTPAGPQSAGKTSTTTLSNVSVPNGAFSWYVVVTVPNCETVQSALTALNGCNAPPAPIASLVANAASGQTYTLQWESVSGATSYEVQEATVASFAGAVTQTLTTNSVSFTHTATSSAQPYFYRVRAIAACVGNPQAGPYSLPARVVISPELTGQNLNSTVPAGSNTVVLQKVFIPGQPDGTYAYSATVDKPWMSIDHPTGILTPAGITLGILADPSNLPNGTFTGTVIVTLTPLATANVHAQGTVTVSVPVSISLVTPVTPATKTAPTANALIIPSVGHLDGINSAWQSDIRLANVGFSRQQYALTFTPATGSAAGVKTTNLTVDAGATTALDDVVRNWYGVGSLGEASNGVLEIKPLSAARKDDVSASDATGVSLTTIASSRTYSVSAQGTSGQYIPAVPFSNFVGTAAGGSLATVLSLQHVAQSAAYRTNVGVVEGAGAAAAVTLSVYDNSGRKLTDYAFNLDPWQQVQLNSFLATQNISLTEGRIEAKVTGGDGRITAYASVVDNATNDPLLVSGVPVGQSRASRFVLPGVAALNNGTANWQTDVRIFNSGASPQSATLSFYPLNGGAPLTANTTINPNEVKMLDGIVQTMFGQSNAGGALHVTTTSDAPLIVSGRTYHSTSSGTYGQFIPAVTASQAVELGGGALNVLQAEDSPRYRTNLGIAEVTGKPATVLIMVYLPDSKVTPKIEIPLGAYEYRQLPIIQSLGLANVYNARVSMQVISGDGKVAAYGSVIDQSTQDPTYVPAQ